MMTDDTRVGWRSLLFVPANDAVRCGKVTRGHADAVILDLEDGVAVEQKAPARGRIARVAAEVAAASMSPLVRINSDWRNALADLEAAVIAPVAAIVVPKVEDAGRLQVLSEMITEFEELRALARGRIGILALIESPWALPALPAIAAVERVIGFGLGTEDFFLQLGVAPVPSALEPASRAIAAAAARRALVAAAVPFSIAAYRDLEGFRQSARHAASFGINGALCVHPEQVAIANEVFQPSEEECDKARRIVSAWSGAEADKKGVIVVEGAMIDRPVAERARRLLARLH
jgi:citrate lyase subunit beta / citryl-CoA lyase